MIPNVKPYIPEEDIEPMLEDFKNLLVSRRLIFGDNLKDFESGFKDFIGTDFSLGTSSAATSLQILYQYFNVKGKEVVVPTLNFIGVANAVLWAGGTPILCDSAANSILPSLDTIRRKVNDKTAGVVLVHIIGHINPEIEEIKGFCHERNLFLIEDCSHAHGSEVDGVKAGNLCDAGVFSMYPTKAMTSGGGCMITTNNINIADYVLSARHHGQGKTLMDCKSLGGGWYMNEMAAILGKHQLKHLSQWVAKRVAIAQKYDAAFENSPKITLLKPYGRSCYYKYQILLDSSIDKKDFIAKMREKEVKCGEVYNPPIHLQPIYQTKFGYKPGMFPNAEDVCKRLVALPIFIELTTAEQDKVITAVKEVLNSYQ